MIRVPQFTHEELQLLDEQSIENMLIFYEKEMLQIARGETASNIITRSIISRFINKGFLKIGNYKGKMKIILSRKGRERYGLLP